MKSSRRQFGLFALLFIPSFVVASNWVALTWIRTEDWTYLIQKPTGATEQETSRVRLAGWPIPYNVAFPTETFGFRNFRWPAFVADCIAATLIPFVIYWIVRRLMKKRVFDSANEVLVQQAGDGLDAA